MIKENKLYLNEIATELKKCNKKDKVKASLFTTLMGLIIIVPVLCLAINFYMQLVTVKTAFFISIAVLIIIVHLFSSIISPIYYITLGILSKTNEEIKYKKLFIAYLFDYKTLIILIILGILIGFVANYYLN